MSPSTKMGMHILSKVGFGECFDEDYDVFPALPPATLFSARTLTPSRDTPQQDGETPEKQVAS